MEEFVKFKQDAFCNEEHYIEFAINTLYNSQHRCIMELIINGLKS